ncbi:hypothetical protein IscW_ISCW010388 [Ixodes scapularis]|uniref:Uncharacterized protein n=1 Tax=Ixodes scapularis TaxID=6945 RepID=B7Q7D9_IXOSC|nr:hypothetical protein IscW_ISCW010388 [Ixodes scapularis]|eukprot:XP_002403919.1 hypothetical protein IscW_ISCW010388 [Ixodes scapularis]
MLRRAGLGDGFYWLGHLAEGVFVVALSLTVMYVMLFGIYNQRGTTFLFYADSTLVMAVLMLFGLLTILHAMLLSVFLWNARFLLGPGGESTHDDVRHGQAFSSRSHWSVYTKK